MTIRDVKKAAAVFGATVEEDSCGPWKIYQVVAPDGKLWATSGSVHLRFEWRLGDCLTTQAKQDAIKDTIERISFGVMEDEEYL